MNTQYLFNEKYFEGLNRQASKYEKGSRTKEYVKFWNSILTNMNFTESDQIIQTNGYQAFLLSVEYPGLLIGTGYPHALAEGYGNTDEDIKTGFSMDYVTGLPVIPGTTVKGTLRSVFKRPERKYHRDDTEERWNELNEAYKERQNYLQELIKEITGTGAGIDIEQLEKELFVSSGDVFLDAYPVKPDEHGKLYGLDFVTPHKMSDKDFGSLNSKYSREEADKIANPNPIRMLKVMPGVQYLFRFRLSSSTQYAALTSGAKEKIYCRILEDFGIGAKTNIGFGLLQKIREPVSQYHVLRGDDLIETDHILGLCPVCGSFMVWNNSEAKCQKNCDYHLDNYFHIPLTKDQISKLLMGWSIRVMNVPNKKGAASDRLIRLDGYNSRKAGSKTYYYPKFQVIKYFQNKKR